MVGMTEQNFLIQQGQKRDAFLSTCGFCSTATLFHSYSRQYPKIPKHTAAVLWPRAVPVAPKMEFTPSSKMKSGFLKLIIGQVSPTKFRMKLYYLQCKQFQFVDSMLFGHVRLAVFGYFRNIFRAKTAQAP